MNVANEKVLIVCADPDVSDLVGRQALQPMGYTLRVATDASTAIRQALQFQPDVMIADLELPGLSGKDLLVALSSQGITLPVIVMAQKGDEPKVIQAFRLGASDYLLHPMREAEVVSAVERALKQMRDGRVRQQLDAQLKTANAELQRKVRDLTTIFSVGRAVISITDQRVLFEKIVEAGMAVASADICWLTLKDEKSKSFVLAAQRKLPDAWAKKLGQPLDDGLGTLVAMSAESLSIHGAALGKFKVASFGKAALVVPIKVQQEAIGLLTVIRREELPFDASQQSLLEAITDYASISLVNARLFRALAQNADAALAGERRKNELLQTLRQETQVQLQTAAYPLELVLTEKMGALTAEQTQALSTAQAALKKLAFLINQQSTQPQQNIK
ncbi:MAG: hypothetical protein CO094_10245 [Anaerolineae bacterium CG_4_9_14_3_um_filter_57_17]|nr:response regulator [bacterium]NCT20592.1 response regulator [bacterium]OIO83925.1 MAG: hypothetical protein AUK01_11290 [Anaerolineae bacterium CG2_30_57_67]PJB65352.1 MAG: hypothetical protein CO094_10245 [Anaerolineae bacterium CG_4_9_14_3_um_filter_57_17]